MVAGRLYGFMKAEIPNVWAELVPFLRAGLEAIEGNDQLLEAYVKCLSKDMQLWAVVKEGRLAGAGLTEIRVNNSSKLSSCWIYSFSGTEILSDCQDLLRQLSLWAKAQGCHTIRLRGRAGWDRVISGALFREEDGIEFWEVIL